MYPAPFTVHRPASLADAVGLLASRGDDARLIAGGQSLIPMMKLRLATPAELVDLSAISGLADVSGRDSELHVGAMVRHRAFEHDVVLDALPILRDAVQGIADQQIRNRGTMAGSLANADPGGDWGPVLLALGAHVDVSGRSSSRTLPVSELFVDAYTTALESHEIIHAVRIPRPRQPANAFVAFKHRTGDFATASAAVRLEIDADGACTAATLALGNVASTPVLARGAGDILVGRHPLDRAVLKMLREHVAETCDPFEDTHGSADYKRALAATVAVRAVEAAVRRARGEKVDVRLYW